MSYSCPHYEPLSFDKPRQQDPMVLCMFVGFAVVLAYSMTTNEDARRRACHLPATAAQGIVAMRAIMTGKADDGTEDASAVGVEHKQVALLDKPGEKNVATVKKHIESVPKLVVIVFAHWCPHCHDLLTKLPAAMEGVDKDAKVLLINGESMPPESLSGDDALLPLEYFPTCACTEAGKLVIKPFEECMKKLSSGGAGDVGGVAAAPEGDGASAKVATLFAVAPEEGPQDPYASLF